jgi:chemotaxis protein CheZ
VDDIGTHLVAQLCDRMRDELTPMFDELRRFVDRRIAELSAEVHGTTQLLDFSESNLSGQLTRIHDQIARVVAHPMQASRNSGLELEAVVQATETAANQIMEAAEVIGELIQSGRRDAESFEVVAEKLNAIFEACTFQDVTGQRIRRAIEHLQRVETMLSDIMPATPEPEAAGTALPGGADLQQGEVDRMFG